MVFGYLFFAIAFIIILQLTIFAFHYLNASIRKFRQTAEDIPSITDNDEENKKQLLRDIDDLEPLSGYGLFTLDRSTVTSMGSVSLTYLIVLLQFKQSSPESK